MGKDEESTNVVDSLADLLKSNRNIENLILDEQNQDEQNQDQQNQDPLEAFTCGRVGDNHVLLEVCPYLDCTVVSLLTSHLNMKARQLECWGGYLCSCFAIDARFTRQVNLYSSPSPAI